MTDIVDADNDDPQKGKENSANTEQELITRLGEHGDLEALTELYTRFQDPVGRFLQRGIHNVQLVEEMYNDVMTTVWQKAGGFRGDSKVSTWVFAIAYRVRMSHLRKERKHRLVSAGDLTQEFAQEIAPIVGESLHDAMNGLTEQHRAVVELSYFHGYSTAEIAVIVDCPQNTVKTRLFHARQRLRSALEGDNENTGGLQ